MNRKGFSLVELLAVIVVLGVIALISTPLILGTINDSRQSAFKSSLNGIKKAIETDYSDNGFDSSRKYFYGGYETSTSGTSTKKLLVQTSSGSYEEVTMSGEINGKGKGLVDSSGSISVGIYTDQFCGLVDGNDVTILKIGDDISTDECISRIDSIQY